MKNWRWGLLAAFLLAGLVLRLWVSVRLYSGDVNNHIAWGREIDISGPAGLYERDFTDKYKVMAPTYPPVALVSFAVSYEVFLQSVRAVNILGRILPGIFTPWVIALGHPNMLPAFLKIPSILADIGIAVLLYKLVEVRTRSWRVALLTMSVVLFNPAVWFNSAAWGQIESLPIFFLVLAAFLLTHKRFHLASAALAVSVLAKQSAIIFLPFFFIYIFKRKGFLSCVRAGFVQLIIFFAAFLPFEKSFDPVWPFRIYLEKIATGSGSDYVTDHAFNFWALVSGLGKIHDATGWVAGIPYGLYGVFLLGAVGIWILVWFWRNATTENLWKSWVLIAMSTFFLATRMHERYLAPVMILWLLPWGKWNRFMTVGYIYFSVFHLANLYHNWWEPNIGWAVAMLRPEGTVKVMILTALVIYGWLLIKWTRHETVV